MMNDLHFNEFYNENIGKENRCRGENPLTDSGFENRKTSHFGRYGCDPNRELIQLMVE